MFSAQGPSLRACIRGNPIYYVEDLLGTSRVTTNNTGVVCYDADFYPYGGERSYANTCPQNYKFEGKERDTETGNDDFGARYYSNRFGRWLSADWSAVPAPVPYANLTNPQTLNLYSMVADDPESFADLDGHDPSGTSACANTSNCSSDHPTHPNVNTETQAQQNQASQQAAQQTAQNQNQDQTQQQKQLSAGDVSNAVQAYDKDKSDKNPARLVNALDTLGNNFTGSGATPVKPSKNVTLAIPVEPFDM